ncbi:hypothetical protein JYU34_003720 [Plutella xylostella]|uniref:DUF4773 domain-containing protein n=1 Tax=Plutella xylostella TaxID=51655 RepID=A0ABQ7R0R2_PLUXY|nr:hypothetical protein JYU34_003720 [Plutella xylostella]
MKLSLVFELLMIFVLLAFAASKNIRRQKNNKKGLQNRQDDLKIEDNSINRYCKCSEALCNCCRDFSLPLVNLDGPGCASLRHLSGDKMSVSLSFGRKVITNRTLSGRKPTPVCMPLPGGISKFCGRVYNIARTGEDFRACLGLELQSKSTVEAAVRVSCFNFGPRGVTSEAADPLPLVPQGEKGDDDDDDDDDDDEDDDDDDDFGGLVDDDDDSDLEAVNDVGGADYSGFSLLGDDLLGDLFSSGGNKKPNKNKNKKKQAPTTTTTTTTRRPRPNRRPTRRPASRTTTPKPIEVSSTTVRVRPARPVRRPTRRPGRRTTTTEAPIIVTIPSSPAPTPAPIPVAPMVTLTNVGSQSSTERIQLSSLSSNDITEPVVLVTQKVIPTVAATTSKPTVTNFEDPGLQMSLASLAGQLSSMPVTPIIPSKDNIMTTAQESKYEKIQTITPKPMTTMSFYNTMPMKDSTEASDDMIQIVQSVDDLQSSESSAMPMTTAADESRSHRFRGPVVESNHYEGLSLKKKRHGDDIGDYDVLGLTEMGEAIGENLGVFGGGGRRQNRKEVGGKKDNKDYEDMLTDGLSDLSDTIGLTGKGNKNRNKKHRGRQNKMMRGEWSQV